MALPKEPRQKMINMMYLVLTALLAINVSAEILNAFKTVNHSINRSNDLIDNKNGQDLKTFEAAEKTQNRDTVLRFENNARAADAIAANASVFIDSLSKKIKMAAHGSEVPVSEDFPDGVKFADDNMDGPTRVMDNQKRQKVVGFFDCLETSFRNTGSPQFHRGTKRSLCKKPGSENRYA
jgi:hypothetical protein